MIGEEEIMGHPTANVIYHSAYMLSEEEIVGQLAAICISTCGATGCDDFICAFYVTILARRRDEIIDVYIPACNNHQPGIGLWRCMWWSLVFMNVCCGM